MVYAATTMLYKILGGDTMNQYKCNYNNNTLSLWQGTRLMYQEYIAELDLVEDRIAEIEEEGITIIWA